MPPPIGGHVADRGPSTSHGPARRTHQLAAPGDTRGALDRRAPARPSTTRAPGSQSDTQLVAALRLGEEGAFNALAARYEQRLLRFCQAILRSKEDAEDAVQDVLASAFNAILADQREIHVRPWLYRIARNRCINQIRRVTGTAVGSLDDHWAERGLSPPEEVLTRQDFRDLVGDIKALPDAQRMALLLREIDGFAYERIADAMGTTVPAIKSLLVRARTALQSSSDVRNAPGASPGLMAPRRRSRRQSPVDARRLTYEAARVLALATVKTDELM